MIDLKQGYFLVIEIERKVRIDMQQLSTIIIITSRLAPMWQQSGTLLFCSCHEIAGFLVDELQI